MSSTTDRETDIQLVHEVRNGDEGSLKKLLNAHKHEFQELAQRLSPDTAPPEFLKRLHSGLERWLFSYRSSDRSFSEWAAEVAEYVANEPTLIERLRRGEQRAFDEIKSSLTVPVHSFVGRFLSERADRSRASRQTWHRAKACLRSSKGRNYESPLDVVLMLGAEKTETILVRRFKQGDHSAFERLRALRGKQVLGFIRERLSHPEAVDIVNLATWERVFEKIHKYEPRKSHQSKRVYGVHFMGWVKTLAARKVIDYIRGISVDPETVLLIDELDEADSPDELTSAQFSAETDVLKQSARHLELVRVLELAFTAGGYPWQLIVFGLQELGWQPAEIADVLSDFPLRALETIVEEGHRDAYRLSGGERCDIFGDLRAKMQCTVGSVVHPMDSVTSRAVAPFADERVGDTVLRDYCGRDPAGSMADWSYRVKDRAYRRAIREGVIGR